MNAATFVDHYAVLGCSPESSASELKKAYHDKLREFHPDKRPTSSTGEGHRVTAILNDAWDVLGDQAKREAYDAVWQKEMAEAVPRKQQAEICRREGNELYKNAQLLSKQSDSLTAAAQACKDYQAAIMKYSKGLDLAPDDHRIRSNRALCYAALKDWARCRDDAAHVTRVKPDFMKGWFLNAKALWMEGMAVAAQRKLEEGLRSLPDNPDLIALQTEIAPDAEACKRDGVDKLPRLPIPRGGASRNVSPTCTPTQSRVATPPPIGARSRSNSRSAAPSRAKTNPFDGTSCFGEKTACFGEQTAGFGTATASAGTETYARGRSKARSVSPTPADACPPPPMPNTARPGMGRDPTPPRGPDGPRQKSSLAGMVQSSRIGLQT